MSITFAYPSVAVVCYPQVTRLSKMSTEVERCMVRVEMRVVLIPFVMMSLYVPGVVAVEV